MERRELLKMIAVLTGASVVGAEVFLSGCKSQSKKVAGFNPEQIALLDEVGETIIPTTDTPGAKATKIGDFMKIMVTDCYTQAEQDEFIKGISSLNEACKKLHGKIFMNCNQEQRKILLVSLEKESKVYNTQRAEKEKVSRENARKTMSTEYIEPPSHYYSMIKQLTLFGYFTSEIGSKQALKFLPVPGKYIGDMPYKEGDKAWAI